jgi:hypothetical protein
MSIRDALARVLYNETGRRGWASLRPEVQESWRVEADRVSRRLFDMGFRVLRHRARKKARRK